MQRKHPAIVRSARRTFLSKLSLAVAGSAALHVGNSSRADAAGSDPNAPPASPLPTIRLGNHRITRLIAGWNPIGGYSYMGPVMDQHMREYFTPERIVEFLWQCEKAGIFRTLRERGSKMKFLCLHAAGSGQASIEHVVRDTAPIAIVHHGGVTDRLFQEGQHGQVRDFVKRVRDAGVLAGMSAHNPDCIKRAADEGWEVDLFMTCFYYLTRPSAEREKMPPEITVQLGQPFYAVDPLNMVKVIAQVDQPCLGFKILAAGRKCYSARSVEAAFQFAFAHLKPIDAAIVGMYPRFQDQITQNVQYTRQFGGVSS